MIIRDLFKTVVLEVKLDLNLKNLKNFCLNYKKENKTRRRSNPTGYQSHDVLKFIETKDLQTKAEIVTTVVNGETVVAKNYSENQTEKATDDKGNEQVYKKEDVVDEGSAEAKKPMSPILKYSLIVGSVLVAGVIGYLIYKKMNKN